MVIKSELTILSFGGGQDSTAILYKILYDPEFKSRWVSGKLLVVMANTFNEHPETYAHTSFVEELCTQHGIDFYLLGNEYTRESWAGGLVNFYDTKTAIGSKTFGKTCTDQLKIQPIYSFVNDYILLHFGLDGSDPNSKAKNAHPRISKNINIFEFGLTHGKINVILGIAKEEEERLAEDISNKNNWGYWTRKYYPLVEEGMDREACQKYIESTGNEVPIPSACILCHFMNNEEFLYIYRFQRSWWDKWVKMENDKIMKHAYNYGGDISVLTLFDKEIAKFVELTEEYKIEKWIAKFLTSYNRKQAKKKTPAYADRDNIKIKTVTVPKTFDISKTFNREGRLVNNNGVNGTAPDELLPEVLKRVQEKHGHLTDDQIREYRFSHGHCVRNKF